MSDNPTKKIGIKFVGSNREAETISIEPGTTCRDILTSIGLGGSGFMLTDPTQPDANFQASDNVYARVSDGDMLAATAMVDAGSEMSHA